MLRFEGELADKQCRESSIMSPSPGKTARGCLMVVSWQTSLVWKELKRLLCDCKNKDKASIDVAM
jgi:hypothetical protein